MRIPEIRLQNQQLSTPLFGHPKELVSWMGAMQAQDYTMVKWAVGMRLKSPGIQAVEKALHQGEILRTHMAPGSSRRHSLDAETLCTTHQIRQ